MPRVLSLRSVVKPSPNGHALPPGPLQPPKRRLLEGDIHNLSASGLTSITNFTNGLYTECDPLALSRMLGLRRRHPACRSGLVFPYRDLRGEPVGYCRVRLHYPYKSKSGKTVRYAAPYLVTPQPYFPVRGLDRLRGSDCPVYITEGEKKALALSQLGLAAVGMSGVYCWKPKDREELLPGLAAVPWKRRAVYVVFDYDPKPETRGYVHGAACRLAALLRKAGASEVYNVALPPGPDGAKQGVDDFLVAAAARGEPPAEALAAVVNRARPLHTRRWANFTTVTVTGDDGQKREVRTARTVTEIGQELYQITGGWPKRTGKLLFAASGYETLWLERTEDLFAWVGAQQSQPIRWGGGAEYVTQRTFHAYLQQSADPYDAVETVPHHPPLPGHYYLHPPPAGGDGRALAALLGRFQPATETDQSLIHAAFLTLLWGGKPGDRPAFLIEADGDGEGASDGAGGRGVGKTTLATMAGRLVGGHIEFRPEEPFDKVLGRLLTPGALTRRVALLDNVKKLRFSWADLEGLITSDVISGHQLYVGDARRPNNLTWFVTLNNASLSKDMAQRCVIIRVRRPAYDATWKDETQRLLDENRWAIIGDILAQLRGDKPALASYSRWAAWEQQVLACVADPAGCQATIAQRQAAVDGDAEDSDLVRQAFVAALKQWRHDPGHDVVFIPSKEAAGIVNGATGEQRAAQRVTDYLKTLAIPELRKSNWKDGSRGWRWAGKRSRSDQKAVLFAGRSP